MVLGTGFNLFRRYNDLVLPKKKFCYSLLIHAGQSSFLMLGFQSRSISLRMSSPERELLDFCLWSFSFSFLPLGMILSFMLLPLLLLLLLRTDSWIHRRSRYGRRVKCTDVGRGLVRPRVNNSGIPPPLTSSEHCMRGQIQWMSSSLWSSALRLFRVKRSSSSSGQSACAGSRDKSTTHASSRGWMESLNATANICFVLLLSEHDVQRDTRCTRCKFTDL